MTPLHVIGRAVKYPQGPHRYELALWNNGKIVAEKISEKTLAVVESASVTLGDDAAANLFREIAVSEPDLWIGRILDEAYLNSH
jgi:hypothetical protein